MDAERIDKKIKEGTKLLQEEEKIRKARRLVDLQIPTKYINLKTRLAEAKIRSLYWSLHNKPGMRGSGVELTNILSSNKKIAHATTVVAIYKSVSNANNSMEIDDDALEATIVIYQDTCQKMPDGCVLKPKDILELVSQFRSRNLFLSTCPKNKTHQYVHAHNMHITPRCPFC